MLRARSVLPWLGLLLILALPVAAGVVRHEREGWHPESDDATIVLLSGDTFRGDPPLVGMISTGGAALSDPELHHPGPMELYLLAPLTAALGPATGAVVTAALIALTSVAALVVGFGALGGRRWAAAGAVTAAALLWSIGADAPVSVWNPYVVALPFACFLVCAAAAAAGRDRALIGVVGFGSFVAQTHLVGLVGAWVLGFTVWRTAKHRPIDRRPHLVALGLGLVLWAPPVIDQVRGDPGNLGQIWRSLLGGGGDTVGAAALGELGRVVGVPLVGLRPRSEMVRVFDGAPFVDLAAAAVPWLVLAVLSVVAVRRRRSVEGAVCATVAVALLAAFVTAPRIPRSDGLVYQYYALWMRPLAAVVWTLLAWVGWRLLPHGSLGAVLRHRAAPVALAVTVAVVSLLPRPGAWAPWEAYRRMAGAVAPDSARAVDAHGTYVVRFRGASPYLSTGSAVVLALADRGATVLVDPGAPTPVFPWGEPRRYRDQPVDAEVWVVGGTDPASTPAGGRLVARTTTLDDDQRTALSTRERQVADAVRRHGVRPGPTDPGPERRAATDEVLADPAAALESGALADLGARGFVVVPGVSADDLFTLQRLQMLDEEAEVRVYVVAASQRR